MNLCEIGFDSSKIEFGLFLEANKQLEKLFLADNCLPENAIFTIAKLFELGWSSLTLLDLKYTQMGGKKPFHEVTKKISFLLKKQTNNDFI